MPFVVIFFIIFVYLMWLFSSVLGMVISIAVWIAVFIGVRKLLDDDDSSGFGMFIAFLPSMLIFFSTPIWDSSGFCEHQRESRMYDKDRTIEDLYEGRTRRGVESRSDKEYCLEVGGWEYSGGWSFDNFRAIGLGISIILNTLLIGFFVYLFAEEGLSGSSTGQKKKPKPAKRKPSNSKPKKKKPAKKRQKDPWNPSKKYECEALELFDMAKTYMEEDYARKDQFSAIYTCFYVDLGNLAYDPSGKSWIDFGPGVKMEDYWTIKEEIDPKEVLEILEWALKKAEVVLEKNRTTKKKITGDIKEVIEKLESI